MYLYFNTPMNTYNIVLGLCFFYSFLRRKCVENGIGRTIPQHLVAISPLITSLVFASLDENKNRADHSGNLKMNIEQFRETSPELLCNDEQETERIATIIEEAVEVLKDLAKTKEGYTLYSSSGSDFSLYFKKIHDDDVGKIDFHIKDPAKFEKLVDRIWDVNGSKVIDPNFIEGKIVRVYGDNTVLIHQCYKGTLGFEGRYFYVLANKNMIDENNCVITCVSINVNDDYNPNEPVVTRFTALMNSNTDAGNKKSDSMFHNPFVKQANKLLIHINPNENNLNTSAKKMYINLSGYVIRRDKVKINITYISSVQLGLSSMIPTFILKKIKANKMMLIQALKKDL